MRIAPEVPGVAIQWHKIFEQLAMPPKNIVKLNQSLGGECEDELLNASKNRLEISRASLRDVLFPPGATTQ